MGVMGTGRTHDPDHQDDDGDEPDEHQSAHALAPAVVHVVFVHAVLGEQDQAVHEDVLRFMSLGSLS